MGKERVKKLLLSGVVLTQLVALQTTFANEGVKEDAENNVEEGIETPETTTPDSEGTDTEKEEGTEGETDKEPEKEEEEVPEEGNKDENVEEEPEKEEEETPEEDKEEENEEAKGDVILAEDIVWVETEVVIYDPETNKEEIKVVEVPDINKFYEIGWNKHLEEDFTEEQMENIVNVIYIMQDTDQIDSKYLDVDGLIKPNYIKSLYTEKAFNEYIAQRKKEGMEWIDGVGFSVIDTGGTNDGQTGGQEESGEIPPLKELTLLSEKEMEALTDKEIGDYLGHTRIIRYDISKQDTAKGTLSNGRNYEIVTLDSGDGITYIETPKVVDGEQLGDEIVIEEYVEKGSNGQFTRIDGKNGVDTTAHIIITNGSKIANKDILVSERFVLTNKTVIEGLVYGESTLSVLLKGNEDNIVIDPETGQPAKPDTLPEGPGGGDETEEPEETTGKEEPEETTGKEEPEDTTGKEETTDKESTTNKEDGTSIETGVETGTGAESSKETSDGKIYPKTGEAVTLTGLYTLVVASVLGIVSKLKGKKEEEEGEGVIKDD